MASEWKEMKWTPHGATIRDKCERIYVAPLILEVWLYNDVWQWQITIDNEECLADSDEPTRQAARVAAILKATEIAQQILADVERAARR